MRFEVDILPYYTIQFVAPVFTSVVGSGRVSDEVLSDLVLWFIFMYYYICTLHAYGAF